MMERRAASQEASRTTEINSGRLLWITLDRIFYAGPLATSSVRTMGCWNLYAAPLGEIAVRIADGPWQTSQLAVVQPYQPHQVRSESQAIYSLKLEAESINPECLPTELRMLNAVHAPALLAHLHACCDKLCGSGGELDLRSLDFDRLFFGRTVPPRTLDRRIESVLARIKANPASNLSAEECAESVHLSFSRFLHLFKQEVGVPFRGFRTWKRARSLLHYINRKASLASVALDTGYPDSTHFSHSIRHVYGARPKEMFAASRRLPVYGHLISPAAPAGLFHG
jgi:AraC-like DNA-binding protein